MSALPTKIIALPATNNATKPTPRASATRVIEVPILRLAPRERGRIAIW